MEGAIVLLVPLPSQKTVVYLHIQNRIRYESAPFGYL